MSTEIIEIIYNIVEDVFTGREIRGQPSGVHWLIPPKARTSARVNGYVFRTVSNYNNALLYNLKQCDFNQFKDLNFRLLISEQQNSYIN
jgi:hypothetical protein